MDYIMNVDGVDIVIEANEPKQMREDNSKMRERLTKYYAGLLELRGIKTDSKQYKTMCHLVNNMTEMSASEKIKSFEEAQMNRIMEYMFRIASTQQKSEDSTVESSFFKDQIDAVEEVTDSLLEIIDITESDEVGEQEMVSINGNNYLYERGTLEIDKYAKELNAIGDKTKGNTWTIYVDDDGELVIY